MSNISEKRLSKRILGVCRTLDLDGRFLGFTLDLSETGIRFIVTKSFPEQKKFSVILERTKDEQEEHPLITVEVEQAWRKSTNEEFDEIGGKIIDADLEDEFRDLVRYCELKHNTKYEIFSDQNNQI